MMKHCVSYNCVGCTDGWRGSDGLHVLMCVGCTDGWRGSDGLCYKVFYEQYSFDAAHSACELMGAHLASVQSQHESDFLSELLFSLSHRGELCAHSLIELLNTCNTFNDVSSLNF